MINLYFNHLVNRHWIKDSQWLSSSHRLDSFSYHYFVTNDHGYVPFFVVIILYFFFHSWLIIGVVKTVTRWMLLVEHELFTLPVFSGVRVARYLVFYIVLCKSLFVLLSFFFWPLCCLSFDLRIMIGPFVCPSSIYDGWLSHWYQQIFFSLN